MAERICSIRGCGRQVKARELCGVHYGRELYGYRPRSTPTERVWARFQRADNGCWLWVGALSPAGYGLTTVERRPRLAHRVMYELLVEPIPAGLDIDHLCHTFDLSCSGGVACEHRRCVNPSHFEVVTRSENVRRGRSATAAKTHCPRGHPYAGENLYINNGKRVCRICSDMSRRAWAARNGAS